MQVILADDAIIVRQGLARLLADRGINIVAQAGDADELLQHVAANLRHRRHRHPHATTYATERLVAAQTIRHQHPQVGTVILSQYIKVDFALGLLTDGSARVGYLLKVASPTSTTSSPPSKQSPTAEPSSSHACWRAPRQIPPPPPLAALTTRGRDVLALLAQGRTDRGIAQQFFSSQTVKAHVRSILRKLDLPPDPPESRHVRAVFAFLDTATRATSPSHPDAPLTTAALRRPRVADQRDSDL